MVVISDDRKQPPPTKGLRHYVPARELEVRAAQDEQGEGTNSAIFSGYAILWDEETLIYDWIGSFTEVFTRGAFKKTIAERGPLGNGQVKFMRQHGFDSFTIGARYLVLEEDDKGLRFEVETIDTTVGRDLAAEVRAGVIDTVSIGFDAIREEWDNEEEKRTVLEARLFEISAVNWPAYEGAKIDSVRAFERLPAYIDTLLEEIRAGKVLSTANMNKLEEARDLLTTVIDSAKPESEPDKDPPDSEEKALDIELALRERELQL